MAKTGALRCTRFFVAHSYPGKMQTDLRQVGTMLLQGDQR